MQLDQESVNKTSIINRQEDMCFKSLHSTAINI